MTNNKENGIDIKGKKILFVSYFYPPVTSGNVPGAMRTIKFIRNLTNGEFHVLTTHAVISEDESALRHLTLPINNEQIYRITGKDVFKKLLEFRASLLQKQQRRSQIDRNRTFATKLNSTKRKPKLEQLKDKIYNIIYHPDLYSPWIAPAYRKGNKICQEKDIDVIFSTGSPWSSLYAAYKISKSTGRPLVVDFRDPWTNNPFHKDKGTIVKNLSLNMERKIIAHANAVTLNTVPLRDEFISRYPEIDPKKLFVLPNGYDSSEIKDLVQNHYTDENTLDLCHTGLLYGVRDPKCLLVALRKANDRLSTSNIRIRFKQVGGVNLPYDLKEDFEDLIKNGSLLILDPEPYSNCIQHLLNADLLVNIQPFTKTQIPSKFYDYLMTNKPILNLTPNGSALQIVSTNNDIGVTIDPDDAEDIESYLIDTATNKKYVREFSGYPGKNKFDITEVTKTLSEILEMCTN